MAKIFASATAGRGPLGDANNKLVGSFADGILGSIGGAAGVVATSGFRGIVNARGNVFQAGNIILFRDRGVVNGPVAFPMPRGIGLMGDAGPEAIMPLKRGPGGKLGMVASGGGAPHVTIVDNFEGVNGATRAVLEGRIAQSEVRMAQAVPSIASAGMAQRPALRG